MGVTAVVAAEPRRRSVQCASPRGLHRMAYLEWGDAHNRDVLVCVHGLTRTGRDFDEVARALCSQFRVVCPDVAGRGDSDPLPDAMLYGVAQYKGWSIMPSEAQEFQKRRVAEQSGSWGRGSGSSWGSGGSSGHK